MPEYDSNDKLTLTLDTLRSDVERTPLADSTTVRRRGDQRTRRQAVGGAVAVVALVAGIAGVLGGAGGLDKADGQVPATQNPTASTEVEQPLTLAANPLFPADSPMLTVGQTTFTQSPDAPDVTQTKLQCMPDPVTLGATPTKAGFFYSDVEGAFTEHVLQFATSNQAVAAASSLTAAFAACPEGNAAEVTVDDRGPQAVGLDGFHASRTSTPTADAGIGYNEIGVARDQNVLVVLYFNGMGNPAEAENDTPASSWVWSAERLQAALDAAVAR
jgi:hypothetical protein